MMAAGTVVSAAGSIKQGNEQAKQARYQAAVAENNAAIADQNARDAVTAGKAEEQRQRVANSQKLGEMRAQMGASGVDVGMGSALDASADQVMIGEVDGLNTRDGWLRNQNNYLQQANDFRNESAMYGAAAKNAKSNGTWGAAASLLSGMGQVGSSWYDMTRVPGAPNTGGVETKIAGTTVKFDETPKNPNAFRPWGM
ncbi:hypothetical protein ACFQPI_03030 [Insolitispirillum peregrinum]|uniref:virion core protein, T7 gp14 family n=1 Tax=Insolitispirillum peregrinum TaxID=80876 RepID=UPI0036124A0C